MLETDNFPLTLSKKNLLLKYFFKYFIELKTMFIEFLGQLYPPFKNFS